MIQAPPKGDGIIIRGRQITVQGFTITGGRDGIHLSGVAAGASANIVGNTIRKTGRHGIHLDHSSVGRIAGNTIENNKGSGVVVTRNSQADIFGNSISGNSGNGITASHNAGVNLDNEDQLFNLGPNRTDPGSKNAGAGSSGSVGGYADGPLGTLDGARGAKEMDGTCIDRLTKVTVH